MRRLLLWLGYVILPAIRHSEFVQLYMRTRRSLDDLARLNVRLSAENRRLREQIADGGLRANGIRRALSEHLGDDARRN